MTAPPAVKPYERLLAAVRLRASRVAGRSLEEEADADRGRVLFSAPFRRLQNKAQVFSLETNAAVRSRLTHSIEVSSIGRLVALQAIKALSSVSSSKLEELGIAGRERPLITFVETACFLHDIGNPPFGHFGELAISKWFHDHEADLRPKTIAGKVEKEWNRNFDDFSSFDGNPQGLRIVTRLQPSQAGDLHGLNLTLPTLAAIIKYPWPCTEIGDELSPWGSKKKKGGFFATELDLVVKLRTELGMREGTRHPLVYLMEAADDIAYCVSDIEDSVDKGLFAVDEFAWHLLDTQGLEARWSGSNDPDQVSILVALDQMKRPAQRANRTAPERRSPIQDFRSGVTRYLTKLAGKTFALNETTYTEGTAAPLLQSEPARQLLDDIKSFASEFVYSAQIVRDRETTAHAVLCGLLTAYAPLLTCDVSRFDKIRQGQLRDEGDRIISQENALYGRIARKYAGVYEAARNSLTKRHGVIADGTTMGSMMERVLRLHLIVDHVSGMTDEFAMQSYQHISGGQINPFRN